MQFDPRIVSEKQHIGSQYFSVPCGVCESRRTERIAGARRRCVWCGNEGYIKVTPRGCFVEGDNARL